ncbi:MAG: MMPL family transporter [Elusimicrobia bacterium]|nr:MMPL family transporter [Elusimicrobiota bacterium]
MKAVHWRHFFDRTVLQWPRTTLLCLACIFAVSGYGLKDFRLDASSDSLVLEHDDDMRYYRKLLDRYQDGDFVVITYSPPEELFSEASRNRLKRIREELKALPRVTSVVTLLDVPLLKNRPGNLKDLKRNLRTLESRQADLPRAIEEFRTSPIYRDLLISEDMRSTGIQVNFATNQSASGMLTRRSLLLERKYSGALTTDERRELKKLENEYRAHKDRERAQRHEDILRIRRIIAKYRSEAGFILGGVPMVVDDILAFIRNDLKIFGVGMMLLLIGTLYAMFRRARWVILSLACCVASVFVMMGILGLMQWDVTVVSSNFVSLQLILTLYLAIHLVGRYVELLNLKPDLSNRDLVREAVGDVFIPAFHCQLTTIVGFASLITCNILPVVNFGWMMSAGLVVSLIITFLLLPTALVLLPKPPATAVELKSGTPVTAACALFVKRYRWLVLSIAAFFVVGTVVGCFRLEVENSFINYFKQSTEIYRGMKFIDQNLGGTTPLDITLDFPQEESRTSRRAAQSDEDFELFGEFEQKEDPAKYWFTTSKLELVEKVHDYLDDLSETGKVFSLATIWKQARELNEEKELDDFGAALLFNSLEGRFRDILVTPYVSIKDNQIRITTRIKDSLPGLRRDALLKKVRKDLAEKVGLKEEHFRMGGLMVLYNNMLRSLYNSQIRTIAWTLLPLAVMFYLLFRSFKTSLVALIPSIISTMSVLGFMGLAGIPLDVMTITIVAVGLGIAVDNGTHYIYRFRHEIQMDGDYVAAMYRCHATIGNNMLYSSLPIILGFSILVLSNFVPSILFGLLVAYVMVIATLSDLNLLPSIIITFKPFGSGRKFRGEQHNFPI